ncbi:hypothetical protein ACYKOU_00990 [Streptococcus suis]|uniref:hypothetical protein n=1 Tax=Streptococcus suis TaxID=1307 RepID=UPI0004163B6E|nr:hypothetical protein [Streptococcus suis]ASW52901.1 hypothetical protein A7J09_11265 [Streptococcus suis]KPA70665.1 hypothetical protein XK26_00675 [Streptococcus suis]MBS8079615.1 hypothetical protein [Streptococcus suis]MCK3973024.1 hypothetical protein [Streptococcus suis]HEM3215084.1 hypothetical protein [Streptococcus suis]
MHIFLRFLLMVSLYGLWLEIHLLFVSLAFNLEPLTGYLLITCLTFLTIFLVKILLDFLYLIKSIYQKECIFTVFPFILIKRQKMNIRLSPYFSFHRKYLSNSSLKYSLLSLILFVIALMTTIILKKPILSIVFTAILFWTIVEITHIIFNPMEIIFNDYKWKKGDLFDSVLSKLLKNQIQTSEISYSNLMSILLYDAINQCTFLTDGDFFEDIFSKIMDSEDIVLCTGLVELLLYELSISNHQGSLEKGEQIRKQLIVINQLDFFCYTSWLRYNFECCLNREYDKIRPRKLLISNRQIL